MGKGGRKLLVVLGILVATAVACHGVRWSPGEVDLAQVPGTQESYRLTLQNDDQEPVELRISVGDWTRDLIGANDFGVPLNGARWRIDRAFVAGETLEVRYTVRLPASGRIDVEGTFRSWTPQVYEAIDGIGTVTAESVGPADLGLQTTMVSVTRSVESIDDGAATVVLTVRGLVDFQGLTLEESYAQGIEIESIDAAGGQFDTINRSNADWITLSHEIITLAAGESREILMTVTTPDDYAGTYWSIIRAESRPVAVGEIAGTQIVTLPSVGLKVFVTAPGSEILTGEVVGVEVVETDPLTLAAMFLNTGNVQLVVTSETQVVSQTGDVVRRMVFSEQGRDYFRLLPGSRRLITIVDQTGAEPLPEGLYQAIVSFDFGGESLVLGARAFRVR